MLHAAARGEIKRLRPGGDRRRYGGALLLHRSEEGRELVEIILRPLLVRVIVAARALEARAEKNLAEHRRPLRRLAAIAIDHRRAVAMRVALGEQNFAGELIVRHVFAEALPQPLIEGED